MTNFIIGRYDKQRWAGPKEDRAESIGEETFDATDYILRKQPLWIRNIRDCNEKSDHIGNMYVQHDGPHSVYIEDAMCAFFGVENVTEIDQAALDKAKARYAALPSIPFRVTIQRHVTQERTITLHAKSIENAKSLGLQQAGDVVDFSGTEKSAEYEVTAVEPIQPTST